MYALDVDMTAPGPSRPRRLFAETKGREPGAPDGLKVDVHGNVYCTGPGGVHGPHNRAKALGSLH